jgi:hypothetical protein
MEQWLSRIAFEETVEYGLEKAYYILDNSLQNLKLMNLILNKLFRMDDVLFDDELFKPFNRIFERKLQRVAEFYRELIDIPKTEAVPAKFQHHSMCLTAEAVGLIFDFFKKNIEKFGASK